MTTDILLYGSIWEGNLQFFFNQIKEAVEKQPKTDFKLRINSPGGNPEYSMSIITKLQEVPMDIQVEGQAHSMAAAMLFYAKEAVCIDTTQCLLHRASYGEWAEGREGFKGSVSEQSLVQTNKDLEKAFRAKVDVEAFENLKQCKDGNITVKSLFSIESGRQEVLLTPSDMKKIGLVDRIIKITPTKEAEIKAMYDEFKSSNSLDEYKKAAEKTAVIEKSEPKNTIMTPEEFKAQNPAGYAQIVAEAEKTTKEAAVKSEQDRVGAWMAFESADPEFVKKAIKEGRVMTQTEMAELTVKLATGVAVKKATDEVEEDSTKVVKTGEHKVELGADGKVKVPTEAEKKTAEFEQGVLTELGLGGKK